MKIKTNEHLDWKNLSEKEKSYTVRVLSYYHFRRNRLHQSWKREETICWELIRALDILPRDYFLKEFLVKIKEKNNKFDKIVSNLLKDLDKVLIEPYPLLGLKEKINGRGDIGITLKDSSIWVEVKTALDKRLPEQVLKQENSPNIKKYKFHKVITLTPKNQEFSEKNLIWEDVLEISDLFLKKCPRDSVWQGYIKIAEELRDRIEGRDCLNN